LSTLCPHSEVQEARPSAVSYVAPLRPSPWVPCDLRGCGLQRGENRRIRRSWRRFDQAVTGGCGAQKEPGCSGEENALGYVLNLVVLGN